MGGEVMNVHRLGVRVAAVLALVLSMASKRPSAMAAEIEVPPDVRAALTLRILEYDRGLLKWAGSSLRVGVVSKGGESAYRKGLDGKTAQGLTLATSQTGPAAESAIKEWIQREKVDLLFVSSDAGQAASAALAAAAALKVPSLVSTRDQFDAGAALGIVVRDEKPHILIRLESAKAAGMDLDPKLLRLAELIR
jgi:hypothetical protein